MPNTPKKPEERRQKAHPNLRRGNPRAAKKAEDSSVGEGIPPAILGKSDEKSVPYGELRTPSHGHGALRNGSKPGNTPGTGRPRNDLRKASSETYERLQERLDGMAEKIGELFDSEAKLTQPNIDLLNRTANTLKGIADVMGKYGPGTRVTNVLERPEIVDEVYRMAVEAYPGQPEGHVRFADALAEWLKG